MYIPKYNISNKILINIGQIEASKEVIENAPLVPSFEKEFQTDAIFRAVYHGTHIEGNDLTLDQTRQVLEGQSVYARERDIQEVINYRQVMRVVDELKEKRGAYGLTELLEIHKAVVHKVVQDNRAGVLRTTQVVIKEEGTGKIIFTPPPSVEVSYLLQDFFNWINSEASRAIHPLIKSAITHYVLAAVHPFIDGNGRAIRAFTTLMMLREGYDIKRFFAIEEHFDRDLNRYYEAFFLVNSQSPNIMERDLTPWIEYFTETVAVELNKIKEKVRKISIDTRLRRNIGQQVALSARQMQLIEYLSSEGKGVMRDLKEVIPMVSEDTILRDLKDLMNKGIIEKEGSTKSARYIIKTKS